MTKITTLLFMIGVFSSFAGGYSQDTPISVNIENGTLADLFNVIEDNTEFKVFYKSSLVDESGSVSIIADNKPVSFFLAEVLTRHNLSYEMVDKVIIIVPSQRHQPQVITGKVTDASNGEPLPGVYVVIEGQNAGTVTGAAGEYSVEVTDPATKLVFSYIGYKSQVVATENRTSIDISLLPDIQSLEEVVVVGYGVQKKKDLTGSVGVVNVEDMKRLKVSGIAEALQGQVAGVSVQTNGDPGRMADVRIRGIGSFSNVGPLYVIDGLILNDANHLNPADIESIQILKDASATALYGSRGANGVIIITTLKGKEGPMKIDLSTNYGWQEIGRKIDMMDTEEFLYYNQLSYINAGREWPGRPETGEVLPDTDWQKAIFEIGRVTDINMAASGGTQNTKYMLGAGYYTQDGVLEGPWYKRYTFRINSEGKRGIITFGENISIIHTKQKLTNLWTSSFTNALSMPPVIPVYDPDEPSGRGGYGYGNGRFETYNTNPVALQESVNDKQTHNRVVGNLYSEIEILEGLTYKVNLGVDFWYGYRKQMDEAVTMRYASTQIKFNDKLWQNTEERMSLLMEHTLNYNRTFGKHTLEVLAGYTLQDNKFKYMANEGYNQKVDGKWQIDLVGEQFNMWGSEQENRLLSYLGRINYNFSEKYLFQFNIRRDGSSKFGSKNRWGNFPSASLGWRISNEAFFESFNDVMNDLKLRISYGVIGDMQALGNYDYIPSVDFSGPYQGLYSFFGIDQIANDGAILTQRANPYLKWETKTTLNLGFDYAFLSNRIFGSFEWFSSKSTDLLVRLPISLATGVGIDDVNYYAGSSLWTNYGEMQNRGFEFSIGWRDKKGGIDYSISANVTSLQNKVLKLGTSEGYREGDYGQVNRTQEGRSVSDFYLIRMDGIFQNWDEVFAYTAGLDDGTVVLIQPDAHPGDVRYEDYNHDGKIDLAGDRQWVGSPIPKFEFGISASANYRGFDFNMFWTGRYGNKIFNGQRQTLEAMDAPNNMPADLKPWTENNPSTTTPRPLYGPNDNVLFQSDRWLENGSFFTLKNLQLGYTVDGSKVQKLKFTTGFRIFVSGQNLVTLTKYKGYNPELTGNGVFEQGCDWGQYPPVRSYMAGIQMSL
ncbi:MAG: TonB-dependent receptor [Bacteroidales bacterium]|nr:TonB-dependent receptor [Bacteroidales bacterium]